MQNIVISPLMIALVLTTATIGLPTSIANSVPVAITSNSVGSSAGSSISARIASPPAQDTAVIPTALDIGDSMDYSQLALKITKSYAVPDVSDGRSTLTPTMGYRLVVVELQGIATKAMSIIINNIDFTATTLEEKVISSAVGFEKKEMFEDFGVNTADAVGKKWAISGKTKDGGSIDSKISWNKQKAGPLSIAICFSLKENITHFELSCGAFIAGSVNF